MSRWTRILENAEHDLRIALTQAQATRAMNTISQARRALRHAAHA